MGDEFHEVQDVGGQLQAVVGVMANEGIEVDREQSDNIQTFGGPDGQEFDEGYHDDDQGFRNRGPMRGNFRGRPGRGNNMPNWGNGPPNMGGNMGGNMSGNMGGGNGGGGPMRYRGRGYGPSGPPNRARVTNNFFRGGRGGPRGGPHSMGGPNYDGNSWMGPPPGMMSGPPPFGPPPGMMGPMGQGPPFGGPPFGGPPGMGPPDYMQQQPTQEVWVETKTEEGKSYYYHSKTRETTWTRPEGCKIIQQSDVESMATQTQMQNSAAMSGINGPMSGGQAMGFNGPMGSMGMMGPNSVPNVAPNGAPMGFMGANQGMTSMASKTDIEMEEKSSDGSADSGRPENSMAPANFGAPVFPPPGVPPFGLPPPGMAPPGITGPPGVTVPPGMGPPPGMVAPFGSQQPWGAPWGGGPAGWAAGPNQASMSSVPSAAVNAGSQATAVVTTATPSVTSTVTPAVAVTTEPAAMPIYPDPTPVIKQSEVVQEQPKLEEVVIPEEIALEAAEWTTHKAPDGRAYYYRAKKQESVWEKPKALAEFEVLQAKKAEYDKAMAAREAEKSANLAADSDITDTTPAGTGQEEQADGGAVAESASLAARLAAEEAAAEAARREEEERARAQRERDEREREREKEEKEKRAKEEKEKAAAAALAAKQDKSRPISSTPISGTPWCVVWTGDGRVFFYNPTAHSSVWERPEQLAGRLDVDKAVSSPPEALLEAQKREAAAAVEAAANGDLKRRAESDEDADSDVEPTKKPRQDAPTLATSATNNEGGSKKEVSRDSAMEAEVRAARERALVPLEVRVKSFREMLVEKEVSAFSTWEKELHKIVFDSRYLMLTSKERKQVFEKYVRERAEEERKEKRNRLKQKKDEYRQLMEEAKLHSKSLFSDFCLKYGKEDRFRALDKSRDRETLFNEFIVEVRKREKDEKIHKREQAKKDFIAMLRESKDVDRHMRWSEAKKKVESEPRYKAVEGSTLREDYFRDFCKLLKVEKKKEKDGKEKERETRSSKKDKKDKDKEKDRDKEKKSKDKKEGKGSETRTRRGRRSEQAEEEGAGGASGGGRGAGRQPTPPPEQWADILGIPGQDESRGAASDEEGAGDADESKEDGAAGSDADEAARDRAARAEASIKEREKEVQRSLANSLRDRDKERQFHKRDEAVQHFTALLADLVRNPELAWREAKKLLKKDHRFALSDMLPKEDKERLFTEHVSALTMRRREKFREILVESGVGLTASWRDVRKLARDDPRAAKIQPEKCEREFKDWQKDRLATAKAELRTLLQETRALTHRSAGAAKANPQHINTIEEALKQDARYLILDHIPDERRQIISAYLEELEKRGPLPPPTASEPARRLTK